MPQKKLFELFFLIRCGHISFSLQKSSWSVISRIWGQKGGKLLPIKYVLCMYWHINFELELSLIWKDISNEFHYKDVREVCSTVYLLSG